MIRTLTTSCVIDAPPNGYHGSRYTKKVQKTSEGSAEPVHIHSLTRAFPSHILSVKVDECTEVDECTDQRTSEDIYTFLKVGLCLLIQIPRMFILVWDIKGRICLFNLKYGAWQHLICIFLSSDNIINSFKLYMYNLFY